LANAIITLTTDYGTNDHLVGTLKGVILKINPDVTIVDITHNITAFDCSTEPWRSAPRIPTFRRKQSTSSLWIPVWERSAGLCLSAPRISILLRRQRRPVCHL